MLLRMSDAAARNIEWAARLSFLLLTVPAPFASAQTLGSLAAERARLIEITVDTAQLPTRDLLVRDLPPSRWPLLRRLDWSRAPVSVLLPDVRMVWNSDLPYGGNDGALWAGRGLNVSVGGG